MFAFLPLLLALLILQGSGRGDFGGADALALLASLGAWSLLALTSAWILARFGREERFGRYEMVGFASLLALHGWWCLRLGWPPIGGAILGLAPMLFGIVVLWWSLGYVASRRTGHGPGPLSFLWLRLKLGLLPILVLVGLVEAGGWAVQGLVATGWLPGWLMGVLVFGGGLVVPLLVLLVLPLVLVRMWGARPLPAGEIRDLLERGCRRAGVRVRSILHWPTGKGRFVNAAAMGMVARFRYVLFTDFLLERLGHGEIKGVLGHELGHIRHRHLWIYLLFILTAGIWSTLLLPSIDVALAGLPAVGDLDPRLRQTLALVLLWGAIIWFGFGYLSRACERQADLAGVELCDDPVDMQDALRHVAELAGQDPEAPSWRHHSIAERVRFLERPASIRASLPPTTVRS